MIIIMMIVMICNSVGHINFTIKNMVNTLSISEKAYHDGPHQSSQVKRSARKVQRSRKKQGGADRNAFTTNNSHRYNHHQSHQGLSHADMIMGRGRPVKTLSAGVVLIVIIFTISCIRSSVKLFRKRAAIPTPQPIFWRTQDLILVKLILIMNFFYRKTTLLEHFLGHLPMCPMCCLFVQ